MKFWFKLALKLGMPVREAQERIDSQEFTYWMAYNNLDPIGNDRGDYQTALVAHTVASAHSKKRLKLDDFVLKFGEDKKKLSDPDMIKNYFKSLAAK